MYLNPDCMRDILLFVESTPFRQKVPMETCMKISHILKMK